MVCVDVFVHLEQANSYSICIKSVVSSDDANSDDEVEVVTPKPAKKSKKHVSSSDDEEAPSSGLYVTVCSRISTHFFKPHPTTFSGDDVGDSDSGDDEVDGMLDEGDEESSEDEEEVKDEVCFDWGDSMTHVGEPFVLYHTHRVSVLGSTH